jgi:hypothetical protein
LVEKSAQPRETGSAAEAIDDYVDLGPGRSLRILHERYLSDPDAAPTRRLKTLKDWSVKYNWQARIRDAATARSTEKLEQAADLDADTFLKSSVILNNSLDTQSPPEVDDVVRIRESVRKQALKGGASVSVEVRHLAEQLAKEMGLDAEQLIADAEKIAAGAWQKP